VTVAGGPDNRFRIATREVDVDDSLAADDGWHDLAVRWLITGDSVGSRSTVVGLSVFPPGAKHDLHRHPNAEEWEFVLRGKGIKRIEGETALPVSVVSKEQIQKSGATTVEELLTSLPLTSSAGATTTSRKSPASRNWFSAL